MQKYILNVVVRTMLAGLISRLIKKATFLSNHGTKGIMQL